MKKLFVVSKPKISKWIIEVLKEASKKDTIKLIDEYVFDYAQYLFPMKSMVANFELSPNGMFYTDRHPSDPDKCIGVYPKLDLKSIHIPDNDESKTFVVCTDYIYAYKNDSYVKDVDEIVCACDPDLGGVLAFAKYLEDHNIAFSDAKYIELTDLTPDTIFKSLANETEFLPVFDRVKKEVFNQ